MAVIKAFKCVRPNRQYADRVAALPYDVFNRKEALEEVGKEPLSFLRVDRPETQFDDSVSAYDAKVYEKAKELLNGMLEDGTLYDDVEEAYYIYELEMDKRIQTGLVACASIDDYKSNVIKKHENTREEKEVDRIRHVDVLDAQTGPIFLAYRAERDIDAIVNEKKKEEPLYQFAADDGVSHRIWRIADKDAVESIQEAFVKVSSIYIADGHHRAASAVKVGLMRREANPSYTGVEPFNYFLSVLFPDEQLMIMSYNRAAADLNGMDNKTFIERVKERFEVSEHTEGAFAPAQKGEFGMFLDGGWYKLTIKEAFVNKENPIESLDVSVLQNHLLNHVLNIEDPRTDKRLDFIGGIRGLGELERRVREDMAVAFSMYPTSIGELFEVSDANLLMPPKSTWFEPKLRSGLFIHKLS